MPAGGLVTGGLIAGGMASSMAGGKSAANAQQGIATAQQNQAGMERNYNMTVAAPTSGEIEMLQNQLTGYNQTMGLQQAQLQRDTSLYNSMNPQLMSLLNGGSAPTLSPYMNIVGNQKNQLMTDLARQLGPGWEQTTAGQQAMQNFNLQSSNQGAQIQQQYMGTLMANQLALGSSIAGQTNQGAMTLGGLAKDYMGGAMGLQGQQLQASLSSSMTPYAGAQYAGQLANGQMWQNMGGAMMGMGGSMAGNYMGGLGYGKGMAAAGG